MTPERAALPVYGVGWRTTLSRRTLTLGLTVFGALGCGSGDPTPATDSTALSSAAVRCGSVLSAAGRYGLTQDLVCAGTAVRIAGNNVTLDLAGHSIKSSAAKKGTGVLVESLRPVDVAGVVVQNGTISGFATGVYTQKARAQLDGLTLSHHSVAVSVNGASTEVTTVAASLLDTNDYGVSVGRSASAALSRVTVENSAVAGAFVSMGTLDIDESTVSGSRGDGIDYSTGTGNVMNSVIQGNAGFGISCVEAVGTIAGNQIHGNGAGGIAVDPRGNTETIEGNVATGNKGYDLSDASTGCSPDVWRHNTFGTRNQTCIH